MLYDSASKKAMHKMNKERDQLTENARRDAMEKRSALLHGDFEHLVHEVLRKQFDGTGAIRVMIDQSANVFKRIIEEVYKHPGVETRSFKDDAGEADPTFEQLKEDLSLDVWMQEIFTYLGAYNDCLVHVLHQEPGLPPYVRVFSPDEVTIKHDHLHVDTLLEVCYESKDMDGRDVTVVWTPTEHYLLDEEGTRKRVNGAIDVTNPYGFIPFIPLHESLRSDCFWDSMTRTDLVDFTLKYAAAWTGINHNRQFNCFKQPVMVNAAPGQKPPPRLGPDEMIVFETSTLTGQSAQFQAIDMSIDLNSIIESLQAQLGQKTAEYGLSADAFLRRSSSPQSGFARALERKALIDKRAAAYEFLVEAEYDVCDMLRAMWNFSNPGQLIPWEHKFVIELAEEGTELSPIEEQDVRLKRLDVLEREINLGIRSKASALAELENITIEEAQLRIDEIDAEKAAKAPPVQVPVDNNPFSGLMSEAPMKPESKTEV